MSDPSSAESNKSKQIICENCILYHKVCSAYGYCKLMSRLSIDIVSPYKVCPFFAERNGGRNAEMQC